MTWTQSFKTFLEKKITYSLREKLRDKFISLEHGSMSVVEYEVRFHDLARHATLIQLI